MLDSASAPEAPDAAQPRAGVLARAIHARPEELKAVLLAFTYFFFLLASYYILRPLREEMGVAGGVQKLPWLFTGQGYRNTVQPSLEQEIRARLPNGDVFLSRLESIHVENGQIVVRFRAQ